MRAIEFIIEELPYADQAEIERQAKNQAEWYALRTEKDKRLKKIGFVDMPKDYKGSPVPNVVYHGTTRKNLHSIMKDGLKPKLNKWKYYNRWQGQHPSQSTYDKPSPEEKKTDTVISTTSDLETALGYAKMGGSTGWKTDQTEKDAVVLSWRPLPTDKIGDKLGPDADILFYNTISPDRLKIMYPESLVGKEQQFITKGATLTDFNTEKDNKIKEINKQLKNAGSTYRIKSYKYSKPRWDVFAIDPVKNETPIDWPGDIINPTIELTSPEFNNWLKQQLK